MKLQTCSIIIPTFNEAENIRPLIEKLKSTYQSIKNFNFEIIIVDDNSTDKTAEIVKEANYDDVFLYQRESKLGIGSAYRYAFKRCKGDYVIIMDADFSHDPKVIKAFIDKLEESHADVVFSSRYIENGGVEGWNLKRTIISKSANFIGRFFLRIPNTDITGSFRLYSRELIENIFKCTKANGFSFQVEASFFARYLTNNYQEVPIHFEDRKKGKSKLNIGEIFQFIISLVYCFVFMITHIFNSNSLKLNKNK